MSLINLQKKLKNKDVVVGIVGLGYVGLPLILSYAEAGLKTIGFDIDHRKIDTIKKSKSFINHIPSERVANAVKNNMTVTTDFSNIQNVDAIILCVPTPINKYKEPDLKYIINTMDMVQPYLIAGQVLSLESTTYPGTTDDIILPYIEKNKLTVGDDFALLYSPEREDPGNLNFSTKSIPKVVGGLTPNCLSIGIALYEIIIDQVVPVSSIKVAEMSKLLENIHRSVNIGLVNEMKIVADKMGINIYEVIDAAATKPFGFVPYYPGPGIGGHCIPIDPYYLTWKAKEYGVHTRFIELAGEINDQMPEWVINKLIFHLNEKEKSVKGSNVLLLGLSYKKNVDDMRESPSLILMDKLIKLGAKLDYADSYIPEIPCLRNYDFQKKSIEITPSNLKSYDAVLIATDHDDFDYDMIAENSILIIDTRGRYRERAKENIKFA